MPAVEVLDGVAGAEPQGQAGVVQRLAAGAVARECPREHVVAEDARAELVTLTRQLQRMLQVDAVIDVEERDVEIVADAVRRQQALDVADQRVLLPCRFLVSARVVEVAEQADVLGQRNAVDSVLLVAESGGPVAQGDLGLRHSVQAERVARKELQRLAHLDHGEPGPSRREIEQSELDARPGTGFAFTDCRADRELHCRNGGVRASDQLPRIRDPRVRGDVRLERRHPVEVSESGAVTPEFDLCVADHAVDAGGAGRDRPGEPAEPQRFAEAVARQRQLAEGRGRDEVVATEAEGAPQCALRLAVVGRVSGLARPLFVGETERAPRLGAPRVCLQFGLQPCHECGGVACCKAALKLVDDGCGQRRARDRDPVVAQDAAEEDDEGGGERRHPHRCDPSPHA